MKCSYCDKQMKKSDTNSIFLFSCNCAGDKLSREIYEEITILPRCPNCKYLLPTFQLFENSAVGILEQCLYCEHEKSVKK